MRVRVRVRVQRAHDVGGLLGGGQRRGAPGLRVGVGVGVGGSGEAPGLGVGVGSGSGCSLGRVGLQPSPQRCNPTRPRGGQRRGALGDDHGGLCLPYISPVSPYISPVSPLYLPYISPVSPLYLPGALGDDHGGRTAVGGLVALVRVRVRVRLRLRLRLRLRVRVRVRVRVWVWVRLRLRLRLSTSRRASGRELARAAISRLEIVSSLALRAGDRELRARDRELARARQLELGVPG